MYVFHYDPTTMGYTGNSPVDFCQLEPGTVIVPAWATKTPPPGGWDSRTHLPFYVPAKDAWQVRPLPPVEPLVTSAPVEFTDIEIMRATLKNHLEAAQMLIAELKDREGAA
ncbi:hypothetical protein ACSFBF_06860 [Variovorax sp. ZT5P49]|uniref:hypothetical protein n=1 Tax=Variovorax sp. ZT5P49 TaxID=3443733 RepID=UPI003F45AB47